MGGGLLERRGFRVEQIKAGASASPPTGSLVSEVECAHRASSCTQRLPVPDFEVEQVGVENRSCGHGWLRTDWPEGRGA